MYRVAVLLFIVATVGPLICSSAVAPSTSDSSDVVDVSDRELHSGQAGNNRNRYNHHHHRRSRHHAAAPGGASEHTSPGAASAAYSGYADSYITKKAAEELQEKLKRLNRPPTDDEYNALLQKLVTKPKSDPSFSIYNKKYYDYLPSEQQEQEEVGVEQSVPLDADAKNKRKRDHKKAHQSHHSYLFAKGDLIDLEPEQQGERRAKRSIEDDAHGHEIRKRQTGVWSNQFQRFDNRRTFPVAASTNIDYEDHQSYLAPHLYSAAAPASHWAASPGYQQATYVSGQSAPWTGRRVYNTHVVPNNYYLPVAPPPQFIVRPPPQQPWMRFPIPGVVYNTAFPPKNPPGSLVPQRPVRPVSRPDSNSIPSANDLDGDLGTRIGEDDDDDDRFIFDVEERTQAPARPALRPFTQAPPQSPRLPATRRPSPPLIHNSETGDSAANSNTFGGNRPAFGRPPVSVNTQRTPVQPQLRPVTRRPPPSLLHNSDDEAQSTNQLGSNTAGVEQQRPRQPQFTSPARTPSTTTQRPAVGDTEPSRCVWAIVNCCQPNTNSQVRHSCFERFGCAGAFWDINPCNENVFDSAVDVADKYFD